MAQGTDRREGTPDSLVGASEITPVLPQTPALQVPNASVPDVVNSPSAQMLRGIQQWSGKKLQEAANVQNEARILDGQMAYQQGKAMEDIDMDGNIFGDKWAMQGYRVMEAQTTASTMLAAQQEMIRQSQYEQNPEQFRATYINRLEQQLDGMDPQTAKLIREQMADHMPTLVGQHTTAYMQNEEQNAFDALSASIDVMSRDATAFDALISNAVGGEGSPSAGLSADRTRGAVVAGTVAAFNNGNPVAYHQLVSSGLLADLPDAERQQIEAAKRSYETEVRSTYDAEHEAAIVQFERDLAAGNATVDDLIAIEARRGLTINAAQGQAVMAGSRTAGDLGDRADVIVLETAQLNGDLEVVAELTHEIVQSHDAGHAVTMTNQGSIRDDALSPQLMTTLNSVLPSLGLTFEVFSGGQPAFNGSNAAERVPGSSTRHDGGNAADGFFYQNGRRLDPTNNAADAALVSTAISELQAAGLTGFGSGEDYMQTGSVHLGYGNRAIWGDDNARVNAAPWLVNAVNNPGSGGSGEAWSANISRYNGDVEAAALAHRTDQDTADAWLANGKSWDGIDASVRSYVEGITASANGDDLYYTSAERLSMARTELQTATQLRDSVLKAENDAIVLESTDHYNIAMTDVGERLRAGTITQAEYLQASEDNLEMLNLSLTSAISNGRVGDINAGVTAARTRAEQAVKDAASAQAEVDAADRLENIEKFQVDTALMTDTFRNELAREDITSAEAAAAEVAYLQGVAQAGITHGLTLSETNYASTVKTATDGSRQARLDIARRDAEQVLIDDANSNGTVNTLPQDLQDRAFEQSSEKVGTDVANAAAAGTLPQAEVGVATQQALLGTYIQAGTVPQDVKAHASAVMSRELTDAQGNPDPSQLAVLQQYHTLRETNPEVARTMLDEAGRIRAEAVIEMAGGEFSSPEAIQQAMVATQRAIDGNAALETGYPIVDSTRLIERSQVAANAFMGEEGFGWVQGMFSSNTDIMQTFSRTSSEEDSLFSDEAKAMLGDRVAQEAVRLSNVSPGQTADFYAKMAASNIGERTALVGGSLLVMDRGHSLAEQMFGDAAGTMSKSGVENEVILSAIIDLAANDPDSFGFATDTTMSEQLGLLSGAFWGTGNAVASLWGGEVQGNAITGEDARQSFMRGVRPYIVETYDNQAVGIRILRPDGNYSAPLPIDLGAAGAKYRQAHIDSLTGN